MISKNKAKFIKSLQLKKYRKQEQCFVVEGQKGVMELVRSDFEIVLVAGTESFHSQNRLLLPNTEILTTTEKQLIELGSFKSNESCLAVVRQKPNQIPDVMKNEFGLVLDDIKDPGNLGTIIRTADWYGISKIIASEATTDLYSPKVISATMGSFSRVQMGYTSIETFLYQQDLPVFGTFLNGEDVHTLDFGEGGLLVIGSESNGISTSVEQHIDHRITIPGFGGAESLNASVATGIVLDNLSRSKK